MTPKEKAAELIKKYDPLVYPFCGSGFMTHTTDPDVILMNAKKCALIAVDEMQQLIRPLTADNNPLKWEYLFLNEVKKELTK